RRPPRATSENASPSARSSSGRKDRCCIQRNQRGVGLSPPVKKLNQILQCRCRPQEVPIQDLEDIGAEPADFGRRTSPGTGDYGTNPFAAAFPQQDSRKVDPG